MSSSQPACRSCVDAIVQAIRAHVFGAERIHADDTTVKVLAKLKTTTGRIWTYVRDDRPFGCSCRGRRGTGRTDFQNGNARAQYDSIFGKLLKPPNETLVYPAHDYKGDTVSTIGEEKQFNPRLKVRSAARRHSRDRLRGQSQKTKIQNEGEPVTVI
jgi:sulfur dioxygenase